MTYFSLGFSWKNKHALRSKYSILCVLMSFLIILLKHNKIAPKKRNSDEKQIK